MGLVHSTKPEGSLSGVFGLSTSDHEGNATAFISVAREVLGCNCLGQIWMASGTHFLRCGLTTTVAADRLQYGHVKTEATKVPGAERLCSSSIESEVMRRSAKI